MLLARKETAIELELLFGKAQYCLQTGTNQRFPDAEGYNGECCEPLEADELNATLSLNQLFVEALCIADLRFPYIHASQYRDPNEDFVLSKKACSESLL